MGDQVWTIEHPQGLSANDETTTDGAFAKALSVPYSIDMNNSLAIDASFIEATQKPGLPLLDSIHPNDPFLFVKKRTYTNQGPKSFACQVEYESIGNPLLIPAQISWSFTSTVEPIDTDIFGKPIISSSGELSDPPLTEDFHDLVLRIDQNLANFNPLFAADMINSVNSHLFLNVFPERTAKIITFTGSRTVTAPFPYVKTSIEIQFRLDGWDRRFPDMGLYELSGDVREHAYSDGTVQLIAEQRGRKVLYDTETLEQSFYDEPSFLDGRGKFLPAGADPVYLTYQTKKVRNFDLLGIYIP